MDIHHISEYKVAPHLSAQKVGGSQKVAIFAKNNRCLIMGNNLNIKKYSSQMASTKRSKGDRLGWESISDYKPVSVKTIVGNGQVVNDIRLRSNIQAKLVM